MAADTARVDTQAKTAGPVLAVLFLVNVFNFYDHHALGAVLEHLRREFHLTDARLGALTTSFTVLYAVAGLPPGRLADTWSRRRLLATGVTVWAGLPGMGGLAASYAMLLAGSGALTEAARDWPAPGHVRDSGAFPGTGGDAVGPAHAHHPPPATERRYGAGMAIPPSQAKARFPYPAGIRYTNGGGSTNGRTSRRTPPLD